MTTESECDALEARIDAAIDRIAEGEAAIAAIARGESVDPRHLDQAADNLAELLGPGATASWTMADVERVRHLRALVTDGPPSPEARALAAAHTPIFYAGDAAERAA